MHLCPSSPFSIPTHAGTDTGPGTRQSEEGRSLCLGTKGSPGSESHRLRARRAPLQDVARGWSDSLGHLELAGDSGFCHANEHSSAGLTWAPEMHELEYDLIFQRREGKSGRNDQSHTTGHSKLSPPLTAVYREGPLPSSPCQPSPDKPGQDS